MPRQTSHLPLQWLALLVLGLATGFGLRLAAGEKGVPSAATADEPAIRSAPGAIAAADSEPSSRRTRAATRTSTSKGPPLTAEQAELLLADPAKHRISLQRILSGRIFSDPQSGQHSLGEEARWLAGFFGWDESQMLAAASALGEFKQNVRTLIDDGVVADTSEAGVITADYSAIADGYEREVDRLLVALGEAIGKSDMEKLETLGMLRQLQEIIGPETPLILRLEFQGHKLPLGESRLRLNLQSSTGILGAEALIRFDPLSSPNALSSAFDFISFFPPIDWAQAIDRACEATEPAANQ